MQIRVSTQLGTWSLNDVLSSDTMGRLRERLEKEHHTDLECRPFSADATGNAKFDDTQTIEELMFATDGAPSGKHTNTCRSITLCATKHTINKCSNVT